MKERIGALIGGVVEGMQWLGTFHSIGARMLRRHAELAGLKSNFTILDADDQLRLMKQLLEAANVDEKRWPRAHPGRDDRRLEERGLTPADVPEGEAHGFAFGKGKEFYRQYQERLKSLNAADFGDLLLDTLTVLRTNPDILADYRDRFKYMLVDEYQDTNVVQYLWLKLLAGGSGNVCVVGDDDQSIYAWRGAEVENILRFERDFPGAKVIRLERNYRSTPAILGAASGLIAANKGRLGKTLWTEGDAGEKNPRPGRVGCEEEARNVASDAEDIHRQGNAFAQMAILGARLVPDARVRGPVHQPRPSLSRHRRPALSTSAPRSATRSPICASSPSPTTISPSSASSTSPSAASATRASRRCTNMRAGGNRRCSPLRPRSPRPTSCRPRRARRWGSCRSISRAGARRRVIAAHRDRRDGARRERLYPTC